MKPETKHIFYESFICSSKQIKLTFGVKVRLWLFLREKGAVFGYQ